MAVVKNITGEALSLFHSEGAVVRAGKETEVPDALFAGRAWPKSTWALVKKPARDAHRDVSTDDAFVFLPAEAAEESTTAVDAEENK